MANVAVVIPDDLRDELKKMADETGISQSTLMRMAAYSLVANYEQKGSFIFADLLNPGHKGEEMNQFELAIIKMIKLHNSNSVNVEDMAFISKVYNEFPTDYLALKPFYKIIYMELAIKHMRVFLGVNYPGKI